MQKKFCEDIFQNLKKLTAFLLCPCPYDGDTAAGQSPEGGFRTLFSSNFLYFFVCFTDMLSEHPLCPVFPTEDPDHCGQSDRKQLSVCKSVCEGQAF